jgi:hypothetical protein
MNNEIYDNRLKQIFNVKSLNNVFFEQERIAKVVSTKKVFDTNQTFGIPSAEALYFNIAKSRSEDIPRYKQRILNERHKGLIQDSKVFDYFEILIESIVFSVMCVETFCNHSIPDDFYHEENRLINSSNIWVAINKKNIERNISLEVKLHAILPKVFKCNSPKGLNQWKQFKEMIKLRNDLVHFKTNSGIHLHKIQDSIWDRLLDFKYSPSTVALELIKCYYKSNDLPKWIQKTA